MSLVEDRATILAELESKLQHVREVYKYYKYIFQRGNLYEEWARVEPCIGRIANYYKMEMVRLNHDIARYMRGMPATGIINLPKRPDTSISKYGYDEYEYNYGSDIWPGIIIDDIDGIRRELVSITNWIKRRKKYEKGETWYEIWTEMINLEFAWIAEYVDAIESNSKYLEERFTYGGEV